MKTEAIRNLLDEFSATTLLRAYRMHANEGEGATAVGEYLGIPKHRVTACVRAGEVLHWMAVEPRRLTDQMIESVS